MSNITEALTSTLEKLKKYRNLYDTNEMAVRDQIINPILKTLGWNIEDPEKVQPNISTEEGIPDYTLIKNNNKVLFLEAKKSSIDVEQKEAIRQLAKYAFSAGTKYGVLTNGPIWILVRSFQENTTLSERIVWRIDLESEDLASSIRKLSTITYENVEQIEMIVKKINILDEIWETLLEEPDKLILGILPTIKKTIAEGYPGYQFVDDEIIDLLTERIKDLYKDTPEMLSDPRDELDPIQQSYKQKPQKMKLNQDQFSLQNSFEILVNTANWLIKKGKLKVSDCPISAGYRRNLVNIQSKHKNGEEFRAPKKLSNNLWIDCNYSTAGCISKARSLLEKFGFSGNTLIIE